MVVIEEPFDLWQLYALYGLIVTIIGTTTIFYIMLLIVFSFQKVECSLKRFMNILMCSTLIILSVTYFIPQYKNIINNNSDFKIPSYCIVIATFNDVLKLICCAHYSFVFLYSYMVIYHTNFISENPIAFPSAFLGFYWICGIIMIICYSREKNVKLLNTGECEAQNYVSRTINLLYLLSTFVINVFSLFKIYKQFKISQGNEEDIKYKFMKKLVILGAIQLSVGIILPFFFALKQNFYVLCVRVLFETIRNFTFIYIYTFDEETKKMFMRTFFCKEEEEKTERLSMVSEEF